MGRNPGSLGLLSSMLAWTYPMVSTLWAIPLRWFLAECVSVTVAPSSAPVSSGSDCTAAFRAAYENRYTWAPGFGGYSGRCIWEQEDQRVEGSFKVGADLKAQVEGIENEEIHKAIASQLW